jgi:hypothetical protein
MSLASRFASHSPELRSNVPLTDDQIRRVAPSIFAEAAHDSRSDRYTYIPTSEVLKALRHDGFQPFMVTQTRVRKEDKRDYTKHMIRLRHAEQITGSEVNEIILLNSHDGTSSYQMIAGQFRFICKNGMVCGNVDNEIRIHHKGDIVDNVKQAAFEVLDGFNLITEVTEEMKGVTLDSEEQALFANVALSLKYEPKEDVPPPITGEQLLRPRRSEDRSNDLWTTFNRVQENMIQGGLDARTATNRRTRTRAVTGIDTNVKLNRALWALADGLRMLKR